MTTTTIATVPRQHGKALAARQATIPTVGVDDVPAWLEANPGRDLLVASVRRHDDAAAALLALPIPPDASRSITAHGVELAWPNGAHARTLPIRPHADAVRGHTFNAFTLVDGSVADLTTRQYQTIAAAYASTEWVPAPAEPTTRERLERLATDAGFTITAAQLDWAVARIEDRTIDIGQAVPLLTVWRTMAERLIARTLALHQWLERIGALDRLHAQQAAQTSARRSRMHAQYRARRRGRW